MIIAWKFQYVSLVIRVESAISEKNQRIRQIKQQGHVHREKPRKIVRNTVDYI